MQSFEVIVSFVVKKQSFSKRKIFGRNSDFFRSWDSWGITIKMLYAMSEVDGWMKIIRMASAISEHVSTSKIFFHQIQNSFYVSIWYESSSKYRFLRLRVSLTLILRSFLRITFLVLLFQRNLCIFNKNMATL